MASPPPTKLLIRPASQRDLAVLTDIAAEAFLDQPLKDHFSPHRYQYPNDYRRFLLNVLQRRFNSVGKLFMVGEIEVRNGVGEMVREIVGYTIWIREGSEKEVQEFIVDDWKKWLNRPLLELQLHYNNFLGELHDRTTSHSSITAFWSSATKKYDALDVRNPTHYPRGFLDLNTLAIFPHYQGKGYGGKLLDWGLQRAKELSIPVLLEATASGQPLYEKRGFVVLDSITLPAKRVWDESQAEEDRLREGGGVDDSDYDLEALDEMMLALRGGLYLSWMSSRRWREPEIEELGWIDLVSGGNKTDDRFEKL